MQIQIGFDESTPAPVVNVASVPQRSPFRYPGGKTWLVPRVRQWLHTLPYKPSVFLEPFAGGASIALTVAFENLANEVVLVEKDHQVAAVWKTIIESEDGASWLAECIRTFNLTSESLQYVLSSQPKDVREQAFRTIVQNRTSHGGILAPGAGAIKNGENGKGIRSRWYPETLSKRILDIGRIRERISFVEGDGFEAIHKYSRRTSCVVFVDPPYTASTKKAGSRLYTHHQVDHDELFHLVSKFKGDALMTYDDAEEVRALAVKHRLETRLVAMNNTHHAVLNELLIGRDLAWLK
jgi:DNA adenine methylase